jgi:uncharacterized glyoxalase superfamily protein PhnB
MSEIAKNCTSTIIPGLRYKDAPAAIEWLCSALGFQKQAVYANEDGTIGHAQLTLGNGMIMLGSLTNSEHDRFVVHPSETGGRSTQSSYLVVNDADAVYATAKGAGAEIVGEIEDKGYGGRGFGCRDLEGHLWSIGTYDPWQ